MTLPYNTCSELPAKLQFMKEAPVRRAASGHGFYRGACLILAYLLGYWVGVGFTFRSTITA